jgi:hypothetical protein
METSTRIIRTEIAFEANCFPFQHSKMHEYATLSYRLLFLYYGERFKNHAEGVNPIFAIVRQVKHELLQIKYFSKLPN